MPLHFDTFQAPMGEILDLLSVLPRDLCPGAVLWDRRLLLEKKGSPPPRLSSLRDPVHKFWSLVGQNR